MENVLTKALRPLSLGDIRLPPTSFDQLTPWGPRYFFVLLSKLLGFSLRQVTLPDGLTGTEKIPGYALQEFHNLPNGYYSKSLPRGYGTGFDLVMLGEMGRVRKTMARELSGCAKVLDLGCGDGSSTRTLCDIGIEEVWGLDPSPYMLVHAIQKNSAAKFVHGVGESTEFSDEYFDGVCACWVFHEVPSRYCDLILKECFRILKPGGKLVIMEPSKHHFRKPYLQLLKDFEFKGLYFRFLSNFVHEPYIREWQSKEIRPWLEAHGFQLVFNVNGTPEESIVAIRSRQ